MEAATKYNDNSGSSSAAAEAEKIWNRLEFVYRDCLLRLEYADAYGYTVEIPNVPDCKDDGVTCLRLMLESGHIVRSSSDGVNHTRESIINIPANGSKIKLVGKPNDSLQLRLPPFEDPKDFVDPEILQFCFDILFGCGCDSSSRSIINKWEGRRITSLQLGNLNYKKHAIHACLIGADIGLLTELQILHLDVRSLVPCHLSKLTKLSEFHLEFRTLAQNDNPNQKDDYRLQPLDMPSLQTLRLKWKVTTPALSAWLSNCKFENLTSCHFTSEVYRTNSRETSVGSTEWNQLKQVMTALGQSGSVQNLNFLCLSARDYSFHDVGRIGELLLEVLPRTVPNLARLVVFAMRCTTGEINAQLARRLDRKDYPSKFQTTTALNLRQIFISSMPIPSVKFTKFRCVSCDAPSTICTAQCDSDSAKASLVTILSHFKILSRFLSPNVYPVDLTLKEDASNKEKELGDTIKHLLHLNRSGVRKILPGSVDGGVVHQELIGAQSVFLPMSLWPLVLENSWRPASRTTFDNGRRGTMKENLCSKCYKTPEWSARLNASALYSLLRPSPKSKEVGPCLLPRLGLDPTMPDAPPPKKKPRKESNGDNKNSDKMNRTKTKGDDSGKK